MPKEPNEVSLHKKQNRKIYKKNCEMPEQNNEMHKQNAEIAEQNPEVPEQNNEMHKQNCEMLDQNCETHKEDCKTHEGSPFRERRMFVSFSIIHRFAKIFLLTKMEQLGTLNCSPPYIVAIHHNPGLSQNELSEFLKIDKGAVAKTVKHLLEKSFIERKKDPLDNRGYKLYLTKKGEALMPNLLAIESEFERKITDGMSLEEKELLKKLINKAATNILSLDTGEKNENNI